MNSGRWVAYVFDGDYGWIKAKNCEELPGPGGMENRGSARMWLEKLKMSRNWIKAAAIHYDATVPFVNDRISDITGIGEERKVVV